MTELLWSLAALLSHWRRHPANFATLFVGLAISTALWSGVQALNEQARQSYDRAAALFTEGGARSLLPTRGGLIPQETYLRLRLAGWQVSPVLEGGVRIGETSLRLIGVEPLTLPRGSSLPGVASSNSFDGFLTPPGRAYAAPETMREIGALDGATPATEKGRSLPPLFARDGAPPGSIIVDIGVAQELLGEPLRLSRLLLTETPGPRVVPLATVAQDALRMVEPGEELDLRRLTDSFHLNLTAFGFLSFLVGLFIVHASYGLAFEQRLNMIRTMRAVGLSMRALIAAMLLELLALALAAGGAGMLMGYGVAAALLPNVAASIEGLYGAHVSGQLALEPSWWIAGLGMALFGSLAAAASGLIKTLRLPVLAPAQPLAWLEAHRHYLRRQGALAAFALIGALVAFLFGHGLAAGFAIIAGGLLGSALLLPLLLDRALRYGESKAREARSQWFWADSRQQLPGLSLALMALFLALATNIGVGSMVEGFRQTFVQWLDQRLVAEVYFDAASDADAVEIASWLGGTPEVAAVLPVWRSKTQLANWPVEVIGLRSHPTYREHFPLLSAIDGAWDRVESGAAALVNEQLARRLNLRAGSAIDIPTYDGDWRAVVAGVFADYGNPRGQLRVDINALVRHWPQAPRMTYSLRVAPAAAPRLIQEMQAQFGGKIARIVDQAYVKDLSTRIFERTFAVTNALNALTLLVAAIALLASLLSLGAMRLAQLAPLWALGVERQRLIAMELMRLLLLAGATALIAVPSGLFMSWCLVAIVNVEAFGWRLPFHVFPAQWAQALGVALLTALAAAIVPTLRLARSAPADLLKVFANER